MSNHTRTKEKNQKKEESRREENIEMNGIEAGYGIFYNLLM
ncbi:MAG: hypothetical protein ABSF21_03385 [Dehalococcoidia bacterium]